MLTGLLAASADVGHAAALSEDLLCATAGSAVVRGRQAVAGGGRASRIAASAMWITGNTTGWKRPAGRRAARCSRRARCGNVWDCWTKLSALQRRRRLFAAGAGRRDFRWCLCRGESLAQSVGVDGRQSFAAEADTQVEEPEKVAAQAPVPNRCGAAGLCADFPADGTAARTAGRATR